MPKRRPCVIVLTTTAPVADPHWTSKHGKLIDLALNSADKLSGSDVISFIKYEGTSTVADGGGSPKDVIFASLYRCIVWKQETLRQMLNWNGDARSRWKQLLRTKLSCVLNTASVLCTQHYSRQVPHLKKPNAIKVKMDEVKNGQSTTQTSTGWVRVMSGDMKMEIALSLGYSRNLRCLCA